MTNLKLAVQNIIERAYQHYPQKKNQVAFVFEESQWSYHQSIATIEALRAQLDRLNIKSSQKALILAPVSVELIFLLLALMASKISPVLMDPRLDKKLWKSTIQKLAPDIIFSVAKVSRWRWLLPWTWAYRFVNIKSLSLACDSFLFTSWQLPRTESTDKIIYTLTSGTTGYPKIISRDFSVLESQQRLSCGYLPPLEPDIHLSLYNIGLLQSFTQGATTIITRTCDTNEIYSLITRHHVTRLSIPPGKLLELILFLQEQKLTLPSLKCILTGGAPIPFWFRKWAKDYFPKSDIYIVYGSTECEPISKVNLSQFQETAMIGYPVGQPIKEITVIKKLKCRFKNQDIYELFLQSENAVSNLPDGTLSLGDLGSFDAHNNLWLLGRSTEDVCGIPAALIEEPIERVPGVRRALALEIKHGIKSELHIFIEGFKDCHWPTILKKIDAWVLELKEDFSLGDYSVYRTLSLPVDPRHQWKLQRQEISTSLKEYSRDKIK